MSSNKELDMQRKRLENVLIYLKANGISQKEIAAECNYGQDELSNFKSGKIKYIPDDFLNRLREKYLINPKYIRLESDIMLNILEKNSIILKNLSLVGVPLQKMIINFFISQWIQTSMHFF